MRYFLWTLLLGALVACQAVLTPVPAVLPTLIPTSTPVGWNAPSPTTEQATRVVARATLPPTFTPTLSPINMENATETLVSPTQTARPTRTAQPTQTEAIPTRTPLPRVTDENGVAEIDVEAAQQLLNETDALHIPDMAHLFQIFQRGQARNLRHDFLLGIGDCNTESRYFLAPLTNEHSSDGVADIFLARNDVQDLVSYFEPTFQQSAESANSGFNALSVLDPLWTRGQACEAGESPLACDIREYQPFAMMVMFGANDVLVLTTESYELALRGIIEHALDEGVIPILSTFPFDPNGYNGENYQKSLLMNAIIRLLADEYRVPLVNFWREVQVVPGSGILPDNAHMNVEAFEIRNELALEMLRLLRADVIIPYAEENEL